jgi:hypothetical protein
MKEKNRVNKNLELSRLPRLLGRGTTIRSASPSFRRGFLRKPGHENRPDHRVASKPIFVLKAKRERAGKKEKGTLSGEISNGRD